MTYSEKKLSKKGFNMEPQPSQSNDDHRQHVIELIDKRLEDVVKFAGICESEATKSTRLKRRGRWVNGILGGLTALLGILVTALPSDSDDIRKYIGLAGAIAGSIVATAGQFIDPVRARQRAIDLKILRTQLENLEEKNKVKFLILKNGVDTNKLVSLNEDLMNKFAELQKEAFIRGVDV